MRNDLTTAVWWIRRDLRLTDNQTLAAALARADQVLPVFVLDTALWRTNGAEKRQAFLLGGLRRLDADLRARGSCLVLRQGDPCSQLRALVDEVGAHAAQAQLGSASPNRIPTPVNVSGIPIPDEPMLPSAVPFAPGEAEAQNRLSQFVDGDNPPIYRYGEGRNRMALAGTSQLSPYLHFGMLSARQAAVAAYSEIESTPDTLRAARTSAETWLNELDGAKGTRAIPS